MALNILEHTRRLMGRGFQLGDAIDRTARKFSLSSAQRGELLFALL
jgi:hypothetical protein